MPQIEAEKRPAGNFAFYERRGNQWFCKTCGGEIKAVIQEPYCPNCEVKP